MPDASDPRGLGPIGWGDAFAALPQETPPGDGWTRVAARLDARHATAALPAGTASRRFGRSGAVRAAGWLGAATAAALALVVAWTRHDAPAVSPATRELAAAAASAAATSASTDAALAAGAPRKDASAIALPKAVEAARKPRFADRGRPARSDAAEPASNATPAPVDDDATKRLDALYAESARLEALLALARDDRVSSAGAALLAVELDAQVAGIDASLAQPGLDDAQRSALWQARVDALRQAAGFESTQRVLASRGDGAALLVSID